MVVCGVFRCTTQRRCLGDASHTNMCWHSVDAPMSLVTERKKRGKRRERRMERQERKILNLREAVLAGWIYISACLCLCLCALNGFQSKASITVGTFFHTSFPNTRLFPLFPALVTARCPQLLFQPSHELVPTNPYSSRWPLLPVSSPGRTAGAPAAEKLTGGNVRRAAPSCPANIRAPGYKRPPANICLHLLRLQARLLAR